MTITDVRAFFRWCRSQGMREVRWVHNEKPGSAPG